ncbi:MAG: DegT/DnrJ/EryC1/StrS family aminotransferase [Nanoarchaeota archaeon]|nr:DegT/DnrJ/EryC1/StrS family aminotransferase [Nanoarchaeota archaeon]
MITLTSYFNSLFPKKDKLFVNSGRSAFQAVIEDFNLQNSKIAIQSFICSNFFAPFLIQNNITPVTLDSSINEPNVSLKEIKKAYNQNNDLKAIIIVHTFGRTNLEIAKIGEWCNQNNVILIEDCVYCMGLKRKERFVGTFGDAAVFSFHKSFHFFIGAVYLKNKGKINITPKKYKITTLDLFRFIKILPFGPKLINILRPMKKQTNFKIDKVKPEILANPFYFKFLIISKKKINEGKRERVTQEFYLNLKKKIKNLEEYTLDFRVSDNFFYAISFYIDKKNKFYDKLMKKSIESNKRWIEPISTNNLITKKYKVRETPNAEIIAKRIVNILINPNWSHKKIIKKSNSIAKILADL